MFIKDANFLIYIIIDERTWASQIMPESKLQSMEWRHTMSPKNIKT